MKVANSKELKNQLKLNFPHTVFTVKTKNSNLNIYWEDGVSQEYILKLVGNKTITDDLILLHRQYSELFVKRAIAACAAKYKEFTSSDIQVAGNKSIGYVPVTNNARFQKLIFSFLQNLE